MNNGNVQEVRKKWVAPAILERASLGDAEVTKHRGLTEIILLGVAYGPVS